MTIQPIRPELIGGPDLIKAGETPAAEGSFMDTLKEAIQNVNDVQKQADQAVSDLATGKNPDIHQTMIALEKADITFQTMMQIRNKIINAYEEIIRMPL